MLTSAILNQLLEYVPETGKLYWRSRHAAWFKNCDIGTCKRWNNRFAGKEAFTSLDKAGYPHGTIFGKQYYAHRVIWCMLHGDWPDRVDHQSGNKSDNRYFNIENGTHADNMKNRKMDITNQTGHTGVSWDYRRQKWCARIGVNRKTVFLGLFHTKESAIRARQQAECRYGFHPNHGKR